MPPKEYVMLELDPNRALTFILARILASIITIQAFPLREGLRLQLALCRIARGLSFMSWARVCGRSVRAALMRLGASGGERAAVLVRRKPSG
jgi:hypothetical protein